MGHPVIVGKLTEVLNARQGHTLTREQIAGLAGVTPEQVRDAMRGLVEKSNGRIEVVVRARAWKMHPDQLEAKKASETAQKPAPAPKAPAIVKKATATPPKVEEAPELLEVLGTTRAGGLMARSEDGRLWEAKEL